MWLIGGTHTPSVTVEPDQRWQRHIGGDVGGPYTYLEPTVLPQVRA